MGVWNSRTTVRQPTITEKQIEECRAACKELRGLSIFKSRNDEFIDALCDAAIAHLASQKAKPVASALQAERERAYGWEEEAKRYCCNSDYWRERAEKAEAALASMRGEIKFLSHELDGVLTDTLRGDFDSVCRITVQRVHDKLSILAADAIRKLKV